MKELRTTTKRIRGKVATKSVSSIRCPNLLGLSHEEISITKVNVSIANRGQVSNKEIGRSAT